MIIDTGTDYRPKLQLNHAIAIMDGINDSLPADATQEQRDAAVIASVLSALRTPRRIETVRRKLVQRWPLIAPLAYTEPDQFDAILLEYAEIVTTLG